MAPGTQFIRIGIFHVFRYMLITCLLLSNIWLLLELKTRKNFIIKVKAELTANNMSIGKVHASC